MIYEISREVQADAKKRGFPFRVEYGPERNPTTAIVDPRVVFERDDDTPGPARKASTNPRMTGTRAMGVTLRIFAKSNAVGARRIDHERQAESMLDMMVTALRKVIAVRKTLWRKTGAWKFLSADELRLIGQESWEGVVYEAHFSVDRGEFETTWAGDSAEKATIGGEDGVEIVNTTKVSGDESGPIETACGG